MTVHVAYGHGLFAGGRPQRLDEMTVRVEARPDPAAHERTELATQLCALVEDSSGMTVSCDVVEPETIARSEGKSKRVVDLRRSTRAPSPNP